METGISRRACLAQLAGTAALLGGSGSLLRTLRNDHPRLLLLDSDLDRLRAIIRDAPPAHKIYTDLQREADRLLTTAPIEYPQSRRALDRIQTLGLIYRLDRKPAHLDRAVKELRAAANFKDWNPGHFPDVAEMANAFAIGYDWLYTALPDSDRAWIRDAIVQKAILPGLQIYTAQASWSASHFTWNPVCNGGLAMAALAIAEEDPDRSESILRFAIDSIPRALASYGSDGSWPEGPSYWAMATRYCAYLFASLQSALGLDLGLSTQIGLSHTGRYRIYFTGPSNRTFNFGDSTDELSPEPAMFWLARRYAIPQCSWQEQHLCERPNAPLPMDLVWYQREAKPPQVPLWPLDVIFPGSQCAFFRGSWEDSGALFLAVKGGDNKNPRAHLDLGSFVLDAGGVRWALDPGADDPVAPATGRQRWSSYRTRTEAHNTPLIEGENQDIKAEAKILNHNFAPDLTWVQLDLSKAYPTHVKTMQRRIGLAHRQAVLIQDTVKADQPIEVLWGMMTDAEITLNGQTAELTKADWTLSAEIHSPRHAVFDTVTANGPRKLVVRLGEKVTELDLNISLTPHKSSAPRPKIDVKLPA